MASVVHNTVIIKIPNKSTSVKTPLPKSKVTVVGMKGIQGVEGKSAFEIAVESGFTGTKLEWLASLKGDPFKYTDFTSSQLQALKGPKGDKGDKGDAFKYTDFTEDQLEDLVAKQPPLDPSPVYLFNIAFEG